MSSLVGGLVSPAAIRASVTEYDGRDEAATAWTVYAVTGTALAYVDVAFDQRDYTLEVERDVPMYRGQYANATVRAAWVRPLHRITELTIGERGLTEHGRWVFAAKVWFADVAEPVALPDQTRIYNEHQLDRVDALLHAIRDAIGAAPG
ncbi:hypothetical protein [Mycobacterium sp. FLAC0960]|uniref:Uncharacterized protein n=1 Tax=Mycobacterium colombiense TaxID=339268 RepID=A0A329LNZ6_9MYCO|nr:hypothetical protein [Mycobacterium sp. FLAC0960]MDM4141918.1 hypothetical protein [Mycobacterium sp. FLAC0960]RAV09715.1 hypothetical protein DQP57_14485 [Mycobacterium colombiense]